MELTPAGRELFGGPEGSFACLYANGPIIGPAERPDLPDYEPLAFFRTELAENDTPPGLMVDSPAIVRGRCGQGRVLWISPHPEQTRGLKHVAVRGAFWAGGREVPPSANTPP